MRACLGGLAAAVLLGCGGGGVGSEPRGVVAAPLVFVAEAGATGARDAVDAAAPSSPVSTEPAAPLAPPELDPVAWLQSHGVPTDLATRTFALDSDANVGVGGCRELAVGDPKQPALDCQETARARRGQGQTGVYRDVVHQRIRVVTAGKPRVVADVVVQVAATDFSDWVVLQLALVVVDATTLMVDDAAAPPRGRNTEVQCRSAKALLDAPGQNADVNSRSLVALDRALITDACAARGRLLWSKDRFVPGRSRARRTHPRLSRSSHGPSWTYVASK
jgi:hypothetical protein